MDTPKYMEDLLDQAKTELRRWVCNELERGRPINEVQDDAYAEKIDEIANGLLPARSVLGQFLADNDHLGWAKPNAWASSIYDALEYVIHDEIRIELIHELGECVASVDSEATYYDHDEPEEEARKWRRNHPGFSEEAQRDECRKIGRALASNPVGAAYLTWRAKCEMGIA